MRFILANPDDPGIIPYDTTLAAIAGNAGYTENAHNRVFTCAKIFDVSNDVSEKNVRVPSTSRDIPRVPICVVIASPVESRIALAHTALQEGYHVLFEPPIINPTLPLSKFKADLLRLHGVAKSKKLVCMAGYYWRYDAALIALQKELNSYEDDYNVNSAYSFWSVDREGMKDKDVVGMLFHQVNYLRAIGGRVEDSDLSLEDNAGECQMSLDLETCIALASFSCIAKDPHHNLIVDTSMGRLELEDSVPNYEVMLRHAVASMELGVPCRTPLSDHIADIRAICA